MNVRIIFLILNMAISYNLARDEKTKKKKLKTHIYVKTFIAPIT